MNRISPHLEKHISYLLLVIFLLFNSNSANAEKTSDKLNLSRGVYRIDGACNAMYWKLINVTNSCKNYAGIFADSPDNPKFFFFRSDGTAWYFQSEGSPKYSKNGSVTFPIVTLIDGTQKKAIDLPGECVLSENTQPTLSCSIRTKEGSKYYEVIFYGKKPWHYSSELLWE